MSEVREAAKARLKDIQAQMYVLGEEAKSITSYLFNADREEHALKKAQEQEGKFPADAIAKGNKAAEGAAHVVATGE